MKRTYQGAVEGTTNIIRQAQKAGIKKLVVTSSIASVANPQRSFTDKGALSWDVYFLFICRC
jgi:nucleoside-diphosphate-sugar epimerase